MAAAVATGMDDRSKRWLVGAIVLLVLALGWLGFYYGSGSSAPPKLSEEEAAVQQAAYEEEVAKIKAEELRGRRRPPASPNGS